MQHDTAAKLTPVSRKDQSRHDLLAYSVRLGCRELNKLDNAKGARVTDALLNYETGGPPCKPVLSRVGSRAALSPQLCP